MNEVKCPKCGSKQVSANKKGFSVGKAVGGVVVAGGVGVLAGTIGKDDVIITCLSCGHQWEPSELYKKLQQEQAKKEYADLKAWKKDFYGAYEAKEYEKAEVIYLSKRQFNTRMPDVHGAYSFLKKGDRDLSLLVVAFVVIFAAILYLIL
jgi:predicted nucleic-acid-binding Zn-ribbon protein